MFANRQLIKSVKPFRIKIGYRIGDLFNRKTWSVSQSFLAWDKIKKEVLSNERRIGIPYLVATYNESIKRRGNPLTLFTRER